MKQIIHGFRSFFLLAAMLFIFGCAGSGGGTVVTPVAVSSDVIVDMVATANSDGSPTIIDPIKNFSNKVGKTVTIVNQPKFGSVAVASDGKITYTANQSGTDQFSIGCDGKTATVVVVVSSLYLNNDSVIIASSSGTPVLIDVSKNGVSIQGKTIKITQQPTNGTASVITSGVDVNKIKYTCNVGAVGVDYFQYSIDTTTYNVIVGIAQMTPIANDDVIAISAGGQQTTIDVSANDIYLRAKKITIVKSPTKGTASVSVLGAGDVIVYQPPQKNIATTTDTIQYSIDGSNTATVTIDILQQAIIPIVTTHNIIGTQPKLIDVIKNVNFTTGTVTINSPPTNGVATVITDVNGYSKIQYTPNASDIQDSLTYSIDNSQPTVLTINVLPVVPAITINRGQYSVGMDITGKQTLNNAITSTNFGFAGSSQIVLSVVGSNYLSSQTYFSTAVANIVTPATFGMASPWFNQGRYNINYVPPVPPLCGPYPTSPIVDTFSYSVPDGFSGGTIADTGTISITVMPGLPPATKPSSCP